MNSAVIGRINRLESLLQSGEFELPVYVRFKTASGSYMLPVSDMTTSSEYITLIEHRDGTCERVIPMAELLEVVAFQDAKGKPVFLYDFDSEGYWPAEAREIRDREAYVDALIASEEYRLLQLWIYDFSHGQGENSMTAMPSLVLRPRVAHADDEDLAAFLEVADSLRIAA